MAKSVQGQDIRSWFASSRIDSRPRGIRAVLTFDWILSHSRFLVNSRCLHCFIPRTHNHHSFQRPLQRQQREPTHLYGKSPRCSILSQLRYTLGGSREHLIFDYHVQPSQPSFTLESGKSEKNQDVKSLPYLGRPIMIF